MYQMTVGITHDNFILFFRKMRRMVIQKMK